MADDNKLDDDNIDDNVDGNDELDSDTSKDVKAMLNDPEVKKILDTMVREELKPMKENMDRMAARAEKAEKEAQKLKEEERKREIKALEESGKHEEAYQAKISDLETQISSLNGLLDEYRRNGVVNEALDKIENKQFRNPRARETAFREITSNLTQREDGSWVHKSGIEISAYVKAFANDEEYDFLFTVPENRGSGTPGNPGVSKASVADLRKKMAAGTASTQEVMEAAAKGLLGQKSF